MCGKRPQVVRCAAVTTSVAAARSVAGSGGEAAAAKWMAEAVAAVADRCGAAVAAARSRDAHLAEVGAAGWL